MRWVEILTLLPFDSSTLRCHIASVEETFWIHLLQNILQ